jgi:hypothetical protein
MVISVRGVKGDVGTGWAYIIDHDEDVDILHEHIRKPVHGMTYACSPH